MEGASLSLFALVLGTLLCSTGAEKPQWQCQEITIPMCKGIGYNYTYMPNQFNHDTQDEAGLEVHQFWPLVEIHCSPDLKFFLCSMYAPICMENYHRHLPACRSVCMRAKRGCAPLMRQYGFVWPERMDCDQLPEYGDSNNLCMDRNITEKSSTEAPKKPPVKTPRPPKKTEPGNKDGGYSGTNTGTVDVNDDRNIYPMGDFDPTEDWEKYLNGGVDDLNSIGEHILSDNGCLCTCRLQKLEQSDALYNRISTGGIRSCAMNCTSPYLDEEEKTFAAFWIGLWSILCCISSSITVLTFCIDTNRYKYPERPIIFLSGCYVMVSAGYIIRLIVGHKELACSGDMIRYETTGPATCTIVFLLIYFFGMASSAWWVILSLTWFLSAGLKWGTEAVASYSQYFHIAAWLIPSIKSIVVLAMSSVDGDPVSGICYVGNQNVNNLRGFVLIPLFIYLIIGTSFLLAGFVSLFRIRNVIKQQNAGKTDKLERLMIRIGVFSVLYTVPATITIACYFYEQHLKAEWERSLSCPCLDNKMEPDFAVYMLKYFMCLVVGITSGFWVWTGKTIDTWKKLCHGRLCCRNSGYEYSRPQIKYSAPPSNSTVSTLHKPLPMSHV